MSGYKYLSPKLDVFRSTQTNLPEISTILVSCLRDELKLEGTKIVIVFLEADSKGMKSDWT